VSTRAPILFRLLLWLLLGGWIGAMLLFGAVVARAAFVAVPDPGIAGQLIGRVLGPLQLSGIGLALALSALGGALERGRTAVLLPLLLGALCAINHFAVSPAVAAIDLADPGLVSTAAAHFALLHRLSVWLFGATAIGALALAAVHARRELRQDAPSPAALSKKA
jgi:hypothetical protein